jgi:hypothetical protein
MRKISVSFGLLLLLFLAIPGSNQEVTIQTAYEDELDAQAGMVVSIPPCALKPFNHNEMSRQWFATLESAYIAAGETSEMILLAPLDFPHGSVLTKMVANMYDGDFHDHMEVSLVRKNMQASGPGSWENIATVISDNIGGVVAYKTTSFTVPQVGNHMYCYALSVKWTSGDGTNLSFHGAKILLE